MAWRLSLLWFEWLLWCKLDPWPLNFCMLRTWQKKKKKKKEWNKENEKVKVQEEVVQE